MKVIRVQINEWDSLPDDTTNHRNLPNFRMKDGEDSEAGFTLNVVSNWLKCRSVRYSAIKSIMAMAAASIFSKQEPNAHIFPDLRDSSTL